MRCTISPPSPSPKVPEPIDIRSPQLTRRSPFASPVPTPPSGLFSTPAQMAIGILPASPFSSTCLHLSLLLDRRLYQTAGMLAGGWMRHKSATPRSLFLRLVDQISHLMVPPPHVRFCLAFPSLKSLLYVECPPLPWNPAPFSFSPSLGSGPRQIVMF